MEFIEFTRIRDIHSCARKNLSLLHKFHPIGFLNNLRRNPVSFLSPPLLPLPEIRIDFPSISALRGRQVNETLYYTASDK